MTTETTAAAPAIDAARTRSGRPRQRRRGGLLVTAAMLVVAVFWCAPLILLVVTAIRTSGDFASQGALALPGELTLDNFSRAWAVGGFDQSYVNSFLITVVKVPIGVLLAALLAYALAKTRMPFRKTLLYTVFLGLTIPIYIAIVPLFTFLRGVELTDNLWGLLGPYLAFGLPFEVLVLHSFFRRIPDEIMEAARVDGAGHLRIFVQIMLPLSLPALVTVAILDAVATWNEFLMALIILSSRENQTIPVGLLNFSGQFSTDYTGLAAGIIISVLPVLAIYALLQRFIVGGLTAGAVKG